ncbi:MAG: DUF302 domain-containing protein [Planctomycetes bacterium]|nr:DUF302 domain-containing protein [Planctomycetota bacterium]
MIRFTTNKSLDELARDLEAATNDHGFGVLAVHDLRAKMAAKGVPFDRPCQVFEVCNPEKAKAVLTQDMAISTVLPCRISVYATDAGDQLELATLEPTAVLSMFNRPELEPEAREVEDTLRSIMAQAAED